MFSKQKLFIKTLFKFDSKMWFSKLKIVLISIHYSKITCWIIFENINLHI